MSRGRTANHLRVAAAAEIEDAHVPEDLDERGLAGLTSALAQSRQQRLASIDLGTLPEILIEPRQDRSIGRVEPDWGAEIG